MKLLSLLMFLGIWVAVSTAVNYACMGRDGEDNFCNGKYECKNQKCVLKERREKRTAIGTCTNDAECPFKHSCVFGYCSSHGTKNTFEHLKFAKSNRVHKKLAATKKIEKRSPLNWPHCVDDFECKTHERCFGGVCRADGSHN
uniref:Uncharacterized protein n=1 Tax=Panagrolaimus superbus TaxID=310955 RepID=A0A914Y1W4_9BILA